MTRRMLRRAVFPLVVVLTSMVVASSSAQAYWTIKSAERISGRNLFVGETPNSYYTYLFDGSFQLSTHWEFRKAPGWDWYRYGAYNVVNQRSGRCLGPGADLDPCGGSKDQVWMLRNGPYRNVTLGTPGALELRNAQIDDACLDVYRAIARAGAYLTHWTCSNVYKWNQRFYLMSWVG